MTRQNKIAQDLEDKINSQYYSPQSNALQRVIIQLRPATALDETFDDTLDEETKRQMLAEEVRINKSRSAAVKSKLNGFAGRLNKSFDNLGFVAAELPLSKIRELSENQEIAYISPDVEIQSSGHIENTTGWSNGDISSPGFLNKLDGSVGTVAVIDSGIDNKHSLLGELLSNRVVYSKDFTGQNITGDPYGHGTHVASLLAGDSSLSLGAYESLASAAKMINLRVLTGTGTGSVSNLIAALDWCVANKAARDIRVINLSVGTAARDSYRNDPLCLAARRAVNSGIVVVVSAGNNGKDSNGNKLYGTISSPGIEPSVITVGAVNTLGTDSRLDDRVATYSSHGPTRGYVTLTNGARKYDNLIKPDLVAPGNRLIGARAYYNGSENYLARTFPLLRTGLSLIDNNKVMYLSGTSMATPIVSGAVMDLIETNPNLTPNLIKAILMYSAQTLPNTNSFEQGAGMLNLDGAIRIARLVKPTMPTNNGDALLSGSLPASQTSSINWQTIYWSKGIITNHGFLYGSDLINKWQGMYAKGVLISDSTPFSGSGITRSTSLTNGSVNLFQGAITSNGVLISDGIVFAGANAMGSTPMPYVNGQGVLISDGVLVSDGRANSATLLGDNTSSMVAAE